MQSLTPDTFAEALTLCSEHNHYKACVVFARKDAMVEFLAELREIGNIPNVRRAVTRRTDYGRLEFFNGSMIEIFTATESNIRGRKCNQLITSGVFDADVESRFMTMMIPYKTEVSRESLFDAALFGLRSKQQTAWESSNEAVQVETEVETSTELDAFLDSFSTIESVNKTALSYT